MHRTKDRATQPCPIEVNEMERAEVTILKIMETDSFSVEINVLKAIDRGDHQNEWQFIRKKMEIKKTSSLYRLDAFIDSLCVLRVGGRLRRCDEVTTNTKKGHVTELIIRHFHKKVTHGGRGMTVNAIRNGYWIINANSAVRRYISRCVTCQKLWANRGQQKMADLPKKQVISVSPFTYCGVDLFGPCIIKDGCKERKRYSVIFTCLASRAIHLESANTLETNSSINALRCFVAQRGPVRQIRSDQGTNSMGAQRELKEGLKNMDNKRIQEYLCHHFNADWLIEWKPNPRAASHMGGIWERQIRTNSHITDERVWTCNKRRML